MPTIPHPRLEMVAPAATASLMPNAWLMPNRATPMVAMVVHELPESSDTNAQMTQAHNRNSCGDSNWTP
ncbi:MAG: hypothetical protein IKH91_05900 [Prevotella sp.]|nr:hypothetical protein [Prevotella sp.]